MHSFAGGDLHWEGTRVWPVAQEEWYEAGKGFCVPHKGILTIEPNTCMVWATLGSRWQQPSGPTDRRRPTMGKGCLTGREIGLDGLDESLIGFGRAKRARP